MEKPIPFQKIFHENLAKQWHDDYQHFKEVFHFVQGFNRIHVDSELVQQIY